MVYIEQIYTKCVAEAAYLIISKGEAIVIDPLRETRPYLEKLANWTGEEDEDGIAGAKLKYIFETHFHADFVSGHRELNRETGAPMVFGPTAKPNFEAIVAEDNQVFTLGDVTLTVIHTPGHTMESSCFLLKDEQGKNKCLFTGDTLFIGDVGRPDLAQKAASMTMEQLAETLYTSLRTRVMTLEDDLIIYPGHGAGSACGKALSEKTFDTLANQKATNYALRADMTQAEFVKEVTTDLPAPPTYFPSSVGKNKGTDDQQPETVGKPPKQLTVEEFVAAMEDPANASKIFPTKESAEKLGLDQDTAKSVLIFDCRRSAEFLKAHIPGTVFAGLEEGKMGPWVASAIGDLNRPHLIVAESLDKAMECKMRLERFGIDRAIGCMVGMEGWVAAGKPTASIPNISSEEIAAQMKAAAADPKSKGCHLLDCRKESEHKKRHHANSYNVPMDVVNLHKVDFASGVPVNVHCNSAYRSVIFASLLLHCCPKKVAEMGGVLNVTGGIDAMNKNADLAEKMVMSACVKARLEAEAAKAAKA